MQWRLIAQCYRQVPQSNMDLILLQQVKVAAGGDQVQGQSKDEGLPLRESELG